MPRNSPFTRLCRQLAGLSAPNRADLHVHTTASDGAFTSSQIVAFAYRARLKAVAITDHDTLAGLEEARRTAAELPGPGLEVVAGVEITAGFAGGEVHLLGYFFRDDHPGLNAFLARNLEQRRMRFEGYLSALAKINAAIPHELVQTMTSASLGRRHVADLLVRSRRAGSTREAWQRFVGPLGREVPPKELRPVEEAIELVRSAGGAASLAHPSPELEEAELIRMREAGLAGLEAVYPWGRSSREAKLRDWAGRLNLCVTGGSDCHGPEPAHRLVGSHSIAWDELERLRRSSQV